MIFIIAIVMIVVIAATQIRRGPRVTQITRTVERDDDKDRDHA